MMAEPFPCHIKVPASVSSNAWGGLEPVLRGCRGAASHLERSRAGSNAEGRGTPTCSWSPTGNRLKGLTEWLLGRWWNSGNRGTQLMGGGVLLLPVEVWSEPWLRESAVPAGRRQCTGVGVGRCSCCRGSPAVGVHRASGRAVSLAHRRREEGPVKTHTHKTEHHSLLALFTRSSQQKGHFGYLTVHLPADSRFF